MASRGLFTILVVFLGLGILFAGGVNTGVDNAVKDYAVVNETMTVNYAQPVPVAEQPADAQYSDTITVYNAAGAELTNGTDYEWDPGAATVTWFNTTATSDGETALVSYDYQNQPEQNGAMAGVFNVGGIALTLIALLLVGQWLFDVVGDW